MSMRTAADAIAQRALLEQPGESTRSRAPFSPHAGAWDGWSTMLEPQVQVGLNLELPLKSRAQMADLAEVLKARQDVFHDGVLGLRSVHFARFLPSADYSSLLVLTAFDGDVESYLMDFIGTMAEAFNAIMVFIAGAPPLPVEQHPDEFAAFVFAHNNAAVGVISAYPQLTTLDVLRAAGIRDNSIIHRRSDLPHPGEPAGSRSA
jgi:hypothetical protein